jgi:hypothetical protein
VYCFLLVLPTAYLRAPAVDRGVSGSFPALVHTYDDPEPDENVAGALPPSKAPPHRCGHAIGQSEVPAPMVAA